jgi:hypothetical protein
MEFKAGFLDVAGRPPVPDRGRAKAGVEGERRAIQRALRRECRRLAWQI